MLFRYRHTLYVPVYVPMASSVLNGWLSAAAGKLPEFLDPKFVAKCEGREGISYSFLSRTPSHVRSHPRTKSGNRQGGGERCHQGHGKVRLSQWKPAASVNEYMATSLKAICIYVCDHHHHSDQVSCDGEGSAGMSMTDGGSGRRSEVVSSTAHSTCFSITCMSIVVP